MSFPLPAIGIDFGTTKCCMAWVPPGSQAAEVIRNAEGHETTPTILYYGDAPEPLVGAPAAEMAAHEENGHRSIHSIKRDLLQARPFRAGARRIQPVDAAAAILAKLRRDAEHGIFRGQPLTRVVITHPSRFDALQRDRLVEAARAAGFTNILLLPEPVAAAIAYERWLAQTSATIAPGDHILVYDFGGGTFDLAVLAREEDGTFREALVPEGLAHLGGNDLDTALASHVEEQAIEQIGRPFGSSHDFHYPTIVAAQRWKELLTVAQSITASVDLPATDTEPATRFSHKITREEFEALVDDRFIAPTIRLTIETFARASALAGSPDRVGVVLIGGGTRVPLVEERLREALPVTPHAWPQRDLAVALGAAWHAHRLLVNTPGEPGSPPAAHPTPAPAEPEPTGNVPVPEPEPVLEPESSTENPESRTLVVDAEGNGDYRTVVEAVAAASPGATVLIRKGTYNGTIVLDKPLNIIGDGELGEVVLQHQNGNVVTSTAASGLVRALHIRQTGGVQGSGIEILRGSLIVEHCDISSKCQLADQPGLFGSGITIRNHAEPVIRACTIQNCQQSGVIFCDGAMGTMEDCRISMNHQSGVIISNDANPILRKNVISDGLASGLTITHDGKGRIEGCSISGNQHSGIAISHGGNPIIASSRIFSGKGPGIYVGRDGLGFIQENDIFSNDRCGILINLGGNPSIRSNQIHNITGNFWTTTYDSGNGICVDSGGKGLIEDNDIFDNFNRGICVLNGSNPIVRANRITGNRKAGISVDTLSRGTFENNDLRGNRGGPWDISLFNFGKAVRRGNRA